MEYYQIDVGGGNRHTIVWSTLLQQFSLADTMHTVLYSLSPFLFCVGVYINIVDSANE